MTRTTMVAVLTGTMLSVCGTADAAETLVGTWAPDPVACTPVGGLISIGALSLTADDLSCRFSNVSRSADVVTWHGRCGDGAESRPTTVVAALFHGRLSVLLHGAWTGPYRRCTPR